MLRIVFCFLCCIIFAGCSQLSNINIPNPFAPTQADVNDIYYSSFPDIPIPKDMSIDRKYTLVSVGPDGEKMGFLVFSGRVDRESLCTAMIHNMSRKGWILRGVIDGKRTIQLYKKKNRYAVLYIYGSGLSSTVESWVVARLDNGVYQPSFSQQEENTITDGLPSSYLTSDPCSDIDSNKLGETGLSN